MPDITEMRDTEHRSDQPATHDSPVGQHPSTQVQGSPQVEGSPHSQGTAGSQSASQATTHGYPQGPSGPGAATSTPDRTSSNSRATSAQSYTPGAAPTGSGTSGLSQGTGGAGSAGQTEVHRRGPGSLSPWNMATGNNPFTMMRQFADEMDRLFESFGFPSFGRQWPGRNMISNLEQQQDVQGVPGAMSPAQGGGAFWAPQIDVTRRGDELVVCADLPGMNKEDIRLEVRDDQLILEGERRWEQEQGGESEGFYRSERSYGRFFRAVPLPEGVNPEQAQASFKDGVLEIKMRLPQQQEQRGRRIEIR